MSPCVHSSNNNSCTHQIICGASVRGLDGREPAVDASGLAGLAEQLLKDACGLPPLMAAVANHPSKVQFADPLKV